MTSSCYGVRSTGPGASSNRWAKLVPRLVRVINAAVEAKGLLSDPHLALGFVPGNAPVSVPTAAPPTAIKSISSPFFFRILDLLHAQPDNLGEHSSPGFRQQTLGRPLQYLTFQNRAEGTRRNP